jgi:putative membrane protein
MPTSTSDKPTASLSDYLAEERTFLAWIRTGLTLMGFGFVVARFGLFLEMIQIPRESPAVRFHGLSPWIGIALIVAGVLVNLVSVQRHLRLINQLNRGQIAQRGPSREAIGLAVFLALVGLAMAVYLSLR